MKLLFEKITEKAVDIFVGAITGLLVVIGGFIGPKIIPAISPLISNEMLLSILALSLLVNILLTIILFATRKKELVYKFGILWDVSGKDFVPHCPTCKNVIMTDYETTPEKLIYYCPTCKCNHYPRHIHGGKVSILDVANQLGK